MRPASPAHPLDHLVDLETGLVRDVVRPQVPEALPDRYEPALADVASTRVFGVWPSDAVALGTTFRDPQGARRAAVGEAVERYCGNYVPPDLPVASGAELDEAGIARLGRDDLPRYSPGQYATPGFPYAPWSDAEPVTWARGVDGSGQEILVPAGLAHLNWRHGSRRLQRRTHHLNYAGIACGDTLADARERALLEVIERDALTLWWSARGPASGVDVDSVPGLRRDMAGCAFGVFLVAVPSPLGVPVLAALLVDDDRDLVAVGSACRPEPAAAARKAVLEALHVWMFTMGLTSPDAEIFRAMDAGTLDRSLYLEFREDRAYLDDAGPRCREVRDLGAHGQLWLDRRLHPLLHRFTSPHRTVPVEAIDEASAPAATLLEDAGFDVVTVDLTTPDLAPSGLRVARTLVPGLIPNTPAAYPYLGMPRLYDEPHRLGWSDRPLTEEDLEYVPLPHT